MAFLAAERRSAHPMPPLEIFRVRAFSSANAVTFLVYAANGGVFFLAVLNLQVVAGFAALAAGLALLPIHWSRCGAGSRRPSMSLPP